MQLPKTTSYKINKLCLLVHSKYAKSQFKLLTLKPEDRDFTASLPR